MRFVNGAATPSTSRMMSSKLYIFVCGYFAREAKAALAQADEPHDDVEVIVFPPDCGRPSLNEEKIDELLNGEHDSEALVLGSVCIARKVSSIQQKRMLHFEQCFHMICPHEIVDNAMAEGCYVLSPGWLAGWQKQIGRWGFDQPNSQMFLGESISKLLLLDTGVDENSREQLSAFAEYVNLPAEIIPVGLGYLQSILQKEISRWRQKRLEEKVHSESKQASSYAMSLDLLANLTHTANESEAIDGIFQLFNMLFAPEELIFVPYLNGEAGKVRSFHQSQGNEGENFQAFSGNYQWCEGEQGFWLRLVRNEEILGYLKVNKIAFPEYRNAYLNQSLNMIGLCALVIDNARTRRKLVDTAHMAGKAELAIDVLHNVGNILNSVNISSQTIYRGITQSACHRLPDVVKIMDEHEDNLGAFISEDPKGQKLLDYFRLLSGQTIKEKNEWLAELERLENNINHIKGIIRTQQAHSQQGGFLEHVAIDVLMDETLMLFSDKVDRYNIDVEKYYSYQGEFELAKHKLLQILTNLVGNAIEALSTVEGRPRKLIARTYQQDKNVIVEVEDNGIGIPEEYLITIFNHGFTTKQNHTGYGLHSAANYATELGGKLTVRSEGSDKGACFHFNIPIPGTAGEK